MTASIPLQFPKQFRGMFHRVESTYRPLLVEAMKQVHEAPIPAELRPFFDHVTVENPQPAFMLIPLMFLSAAEASGGITPRHIDALPSLLLSMEVTAIADDTVDRTPMRSGRMSFPRRFGEASATPFTGALLMLMNQRARRCPPGFVDALQDYVLRICSMFLWERQSTYPEREAFAPWLAQRYGATAAATTFTLGSALALNGHAPLTPAAVDHFSYIFQDVDDLVSILEHRDAQGENEDLQMGIVTRPLMLTLERRPELAASVEQLWAEYRPLQRASLAEFQQLHAEVSERTRPLHQRLLQAMREIGVPETARRMVEDLRQCVEHTPAFLRPFVRELCLSVIDRLHRCEAPEVSRILDVCFREEPRKEAAGPAVPRKPRTVCVYCSSSGVVEPAWFKLASALGAELGRRGDRLVFGGGNTGLMGAVAHAAREHGGEVISVIPEVMRGTPYVFEHSTELLVTTDLRGRKAAMEARADAFVVLPGGFGTLDEALEVLAAKQLHQHRKPIVFVNAQGFWEPLTALFEHLFRQRFASAEHHRALYHLARGPEEVFTYLDSYEPPPFPAKWF